jgi:Fe-Mn family superoxide dismutase
MTRREVLEGLAATAAITVLGPELGARQAPASGGWPIKPLPFDPKKLKGLSEKLMVSHHDNNYAGAARRIGQIQQMLAGLPNNAPGFQLKGQAQRLIATNSAILTRSTSGISAAMEISGTLQQAITVDFGVSTNGNRALGYVDSA